LKKGIPESGGKGGINHLQKWFLVSLGSCGLKSKCDY